MGVFLGFLCIWSLEITVLALITAGACYAFRKQPGNTHAALWTAALCVIWILPLAPVIIPEFISPPAINTVIVKSIEANQQEKEGFNQASVKRSPQNVAIHRTRERAGSPTQTRVDNHRIQNGNQQPAGVDAQQYTVSNTAVPLLFSLWCVGVVLSLLRWARSHLSVHRLLRESHKIDDSRVVEEIERTRQLLFINGHIRLRTADSQTAPFVMGLLKPTIFFPTYMLKGWSQRERLAVVAHELAHVRRYDLAAHHAMRLLRIVLWFLPPVWWMQRELHRSQDAACDECAAVVLGSGPEFGRALAQLAESCLIADPVFPALGLLHSKPSLITRLENIMNARIPKLSRLSLKFKFVLLLFSCAAFIGVGTLDRAAASQTLSVERLGTYAGDRHAITIHSVAYASPYYVVIGKQYDHRIILYYEYENGAPALRYTIRPDSSLLTDPNATLRHTVANERFLVLFYEHNDAFYYFVVDHSQEPQLIRHVPIAPFCDRVSYARLDGDDLYFIDIKQNGRIYRHTLTQENPTANHWSAVIPEHIITSSFETFNNEFLLGDGFGDDDSNVDPAIGSKIGVARAWIDENNSLEIDLKRWFSDISTPFIYNIEKNDTNVFVSRSTRQTWKDEVLVIDWSDKDAPKIVQTLEAGDTNTKGIYACGPLLVFPSRPETTTPHSDIALYSKIDGEYQFAAQFPNAQGTIVLGQEFMINYDRSSVTFYDVLDPFQPVEIQADFESAPLFGPLAAADLYLYAAMHVKNEGHFVTLDASIPFDLRIVDQKILPDGQSTSIQAKDGFFCLQRDELTVYKLNDDGSLGIEIPFPAKPTDRADSKLRKPVYNDSLFLSVYYVPQPDGSHTPDPTYPEIHIHKRTEDSIDETVSSVLSLSTNTLCIALHNDFLFEFKSESDSELVDGVLTTHTDNYAITYSLENPERPLYLATYPIPHGDESDSVGGRYVVEAVGSGAYLAYRSTMGQSGILDASDPSALKHVGYLPSGRAIFWYEGLVGLVDKKGDIVFYAIDKQEGPLEVARIDDAMGRRVCVSNNRLYISNTKGAIDIYELNVNTTGMLDWAVH